METHKIMRALETIIEMLEEDYDREDIISYIERTLLDALREKTTKI